ncbi:hypothetical protein GCM10025777_27880 [Membranihabitans marinus]
MILLMKFTKLLVALMLAMTSMIFVSCDDDKEDDPVVPTTITVTGKITDSEDASAIAGVSIDAGSTSATSGNDGSYSIVAPKEGLLSFSKQGYVSKVQDVNNSTTIDIQLTPEAMEVETVILSGLTTGDMTLTADKIYQINQKFVVSDGHTVTIEPGTILKGAQGTGSVASAFIVARGGKLMAEGTAEKPIIFTSVLDNITVGEKFGTNLTEIDREKWGGLIVLGKSIISAEDGDDVAQIEGIPGDEDFGKFGGTDPEDNSGSLKYISIRHGGALIGDGNEINGLTLGGVGSGTTIENIEIIANLDDGVEFFGGTVNAKNILVSYQGDDAIDIDMNYSGTIENVVVIHGGDDSDEALELDGPENTAQDGLFTLKNGTFIKTGGQGSAADFKSKTQGTIENCVFKGYGSDAFQLRANFDSENGCAPKSDAYSYLVQDNPRLVLKNNEIVASETVETLFKLYTGVAACAGSITNEMLLQAATILDTDNNKVVTQETAGLGADFSAFEGWTWSKDQGLLD